MSRTRKRIKVLVCTRFTLFRDGLKALFEPSDRLEIAADTATGEEAIQAAERLRPDVVLLDVDLPDLSGFATMHRILAVDPDARILIMTLSRNHRGQIARCLESGAAGLIRRKDRPEQLEAAILAVVGRRRPAGTGHHFVAGGRRA
jgi:DNA-binding NarL/FixJ family response regulator